MPEGPMHIFGAMHPPSVIGPVVARAEFCSQSSPGCEGKRNHVCERIMLATGPSRPTSVLIRTYLGFYLEYKNNIGIVGKVKMSSSFELGEAEAPPKTA